MELAEKSSVFEKAMDVLSEVRAEGIRELLSLLESGVPLAEAKKKLGVI